MLEVICGTTAVEIIEIGLDWVAELEAIAVATDAVEDNEDTTEEEGEAGATDAMRSAVYVGV